GPAAPKKPALTVVKSIASRSLSSSSPGRSERAISWPPDSNYWYWRSRHRELRRRIVERCSCRTRRPYARRRARRAREGIRARASREGTVSVADEQPALRGAPGL